MRRVSILWGLESVGMKASRQLYDGMMGSRSVQTGGLKIEFNQPGESLGVDKSIAPVAEVTHLAASSILISPVGLDIVLFYFE
jgi:hypothetical protein